MKGYNYQSQDSNRTKNDYNNSIIGESTDWLHQLNEISKSSFQSEKNFKLDHQR